MTDPILFALVVVGASAATLLVFAMACLLILVAMCWAIDIWQRMDDDGRAPSILKLRRFMHRYRVRLAIALMCFAIILTPSARELVWMVVAFMTGMVIEPWVQRSESAQR